MKLQLNDPSHVDPSDSQFLTAGHVEPMSAYGRKVPLLNVRFSPITARAYRPSVHYNPSSQSTTATGNAPLFTLWIDERE